MDHPNVQQMLYHGTERQKSKLCYTVIICLLRCVKSTTFSGKKTLVLLVFATFGRNTLDITMGFGPYVYSMWKKYATLFTLRRKQTFMLDPPSVVMSRTAVDCLQSLTKK